MRVVVPPEKGIRVVCSWERSAGRANPVSSDLMPLAYTDPYFVGGGLTTVITHTDYYALLH